MPWNLSNLEIMQAASNKWPVPLKESEVEAWMHEEYRFIADRQAEHCWEWLREKGIEVPQ